MRLPTLLLPSLPLTTSFLFPPPPNRDLRLNQIQVIGTHNSYHREVSPLERTVLEQFAPNVQDLYYSHASLPTQLSHQRIRSLELDLHCDTQGGLYSSPLIWQFANITAETAPYNISIMQEPGIKVFHITDVDTNSVCYTFVQCLTQLRNWSRENEETFTDYGAFGIES